MILGKRIRRALDYLHQSKRDEDNNIPTQLEKGDIPAMIISALIVFLPIALLVLLIMVGIAWLWIK